ncbi:phospholipid carrier-dependent glycosyltransferase [Candidatus Woesearchaeota archaeon]|nr:phospholipid carrier-dependent glycosyltransferase [Candidatus Woesearchaeota archaeon]
MINRLKYFFKENKALIALLVLGFLMRLIFFDTSYFFWDEANYIMNAEFIARGKPPFVQMDERPPLLSLFILPFIGSEFLMRFVMIMLNLIAIPAIYYLALNFNKKTAIVASALVAVFPFHIMAGRWVMTDSLSFLFITLTIAFYLAAAKRNWIKYYLIGGIFLGLSFLLKYTNLLLLPILMALFLVFRADYKLALCSLLVSVIVIIPYLIFNHLYFGSILYPIIRATHVIKTGAPLPITVVFWHIIWFFGPLLLFFLLFIFCHKIKKLEFFMLCWLVLALFYFILLSQKGIAMPESIEWEIQRFLLPALAPVVLLSSAFLSELCKGKLVLSFFIVLLLFIPSYITAYTPMISFENGLREVSKDVALHIKDNYNNDIGIYCEENYPVIAYYSRKKTSSNIKELENFSEVYHIRIQKSETTDRNAVYSAKKGLYAAVLTPLS